MSEQEAPYGTMNEALAYGWAAQAMRGLEGKLEASDAQTLTDRISSAILEAHKKGRSQSQKLPQSSPGHETVTPRLKEMLLPLLEQREQDGIATYGRTLETFTGRPAWTDLSQELIDAMQYGLQLEMERQTLAGWLKEALQLADEVIRMLPISYLDDDVPFWTGDLRGRWCAIQEKASKSGVMGE